MTTTENDTSAVADPAPGISPRPVVDRLPRYAAGKPPVAIEGLQSYKLSSNENPFPPLPSVLEAIAAHPNVHRYPDPLATALRTELASFLNVPAEDIVTGGGSLGALNQLLATFAGQGEMKKHPISLGSTPCFRANSVRAIMAATSIGWRTSTI
ncbi:MAG: hypothetical protein ABS909_08560, partial [Arthrobacter sp.]